MVDDWLSQLRGIHDASIHSDWASLAANVNRRSSLTGGSEMEPSRPGLPPIWFQGNVEGIKPGNWVLVMSLNVATGCWSCR